MMLNTLRNIPTWCNVDRFHCFICIIVFVKSFIQPFSAHIFWCCSLMIVNLAPQGSYNSLSKERFSLHAKYISIECHETMTSLIYRLFAKALQKLDTLSVNGKLCRKSVLLIPFFHQLHFLSQISTYECEFDSFMFTLLVKKVPTINHDVFYFYL